MPDKTKDRLAPLPAASSVVATVHCTGDLTRARTLDNSTPLDFIELRLDCLLEESSSVKQLLDQTCLPVIATARAATEGGARDLATTQRAELLSNALSGSTIIDMELASTDLRNELQPAIDDHQCLLMLSLHDFTGTPDLVQLQNWQEQALAAGANIFKVATWVRNAADLYTLHRFLELAEMPVAVMGMGPIGKCSRLLLAVAGSCLNYGYLTTPNAPGQWPAEILAERIRECLTQAE